MVRRVHVSSIEVEVVRAVSIRGVRGRRPIEAVVAGGVQVLMVRMDAPAADEGMAHLKTKASYSLPSTLLLAG